jgi:hypothetical protein
MEASRSKRNTSLWCGQPSLRVGKTGFAWAKPSAPRSPLRHGAQAGREKEQGAFQEPAVGRGCPQPAANVETISGPSPTPQRGRTPLPYRTLKFMEVSRSKRTTSLWRGHPSLRVGKTGFARAKPSAPRSPLRHGARAGQEKEQGAFQEPAVGRGCPQPAANVARSAASPPTPSVRRNVPQRRQRWRSGGGFPFAAFADFVGHPVCQFFPRAHVRLEQEAHLVSNGIGA